MIKLDSSKLSIIQKKNGKTSKVLHSDFNFFFWPYEEQTKIKHFVFEQYFDAWIKILGKYNKLNYIDGFAGCGAYIDLNNSTFYCGSPVRAGEVIKQNNISFNRNVCIVVIEQDQENIDNLKKVFEYRYLTNLKPNFIKGDFDQEINKILDNSNCNLSPTFFFIDPFGFKIKYNTLKKIMSVKKSEIFLNFMFTRIQQFLTAPEMENNMDELFGCSDWRNIKATGDEKEKEIIELFRRQLKRFSKFVFPYRVSFPNKDKTYYYLFHLTNDLKGCSIMKDSFAKFNEGKVEYSGHKLQMNLFDMKDYKILQCESYLIEKYSNKNLTYEQILVDNIDETEFLERHFRDAIKSLSKQKRINLIQIPPTTDSGKPKRRIDYADIIYFK